MYWSSQENHPPNSNTTLRTSTSYLAPSDDNFTNETTSRPWLTSRYYSGADLTTFDLYNNDYNINNANNTLTNNTHSYSKYSRKPHQIKPKENIKTNKIPVRNGYANIDTLYGFFEEVNQALCVT